MLLKSPKIYELINELIHKYSPFNWVVDTDTDRELLPVTSEDISKLCKVRSDESVWILKNFSDKGLKWEVLSGLNAYELDKKYNGFVGTLDEWFEHWRGFSAFEVWQQTTNKPNSNETEFFDYLKGESGNETSVYTFSERRLNKVWTNKKQTWRKVVNLGLLSYNSYTEAIHEIYDLEHITALYGFAINNNGSTYTIPTSISNFQVSIIYDVTNPTKFKVQTTGDWRSYTGLAVVEYTKKNDKVLTDSEIDALVTGRGEPGKSSYDLAKEYGGFTGTEAEWYDMIVNRNDKNILIYGASDPTDFIPIINYTNFDPSLHTSNQKVFTHNKAKWIREGKNLYIQGTFASTATGTGNRTDIFLPENLTIDDISNAPGVEGVIGNCFILNTNDSNQYFISAIKDTKYVTLKFQQTASNNNNLNISTGKIYTYWFKVPIKEWSASKILPLNSLENTIGDSAYQIAIKKGYSGTEEEWIKSLSSYGIAVKNGYTGTEEEWITALLDKEKYNVLAYSAGKEIEFIPEIENVLTTENKATYVREGKNIYVRGLLTFSSTFTGEFRLHLPPNLTLNCFTTITDKDKHNLLGEANHISDSTYIFNIIGNNNNKYINFYRHDNKILGTGISDLTNSTFTYFFKASINEWQGSEFAEQIWDGTVGNSAYQIALKNGYIGTETEWLESLSSFSIAKKHGFTGTEEEWYTLLSQMKEKYVYSFSAGIENKYSPIFTNINVTESNATYVREGKNLFCRGIATFSTNSTGEVTLSLPPNITIDKLDKTTSLNPDFTVVGYIDKTNSTDSSLYALIANSDTNILKIKNKTSQTLVGSNWNVSGTTITYWFKIPIKEWEGSVFADEVWSGSIGDSAYQIAIKKGYSGTEEEWIKSLSSYGIAVKNGYTGTEEEWIKLLSENTEQKVFAYSSTVPKKYENPLWENITVTTSNISYVREGRFMVVQGNLNFPAHALPGRLKLYLPLKNELFISGLESSETVYYTIVGSASIYNTSNNIKICADNNTNYVYFRDLNNNRFIGDSRESYSTGGMTFYFRVPIYQWKGSTVLEEIWDGTIGDSAYQIALNNGYIGTEQEWLETLTAYGLAQRQGFEGTLDDYLFSLNAIGTAKSTGLLDKDATEEDWYKSISAWGLAKKYDGYGGTLNDWLAEQRMSKFPDNGTTGQLLVKQSETKDDVAWQDITYDVKTYVHEQIEPSIKWIINHNLNTTEYDYIVKDENLEMVLCDINLEESTPNTLVIEFRTAMYGQCMIYAKSSASIPIQTRTIVVESYAEKVKNLGEVMGSLNVYISDAHIQTLTLKGDTNISFKNWAPEEYSTSITLHIKSLGNFKLILNDKIIYSAGTSFIITTNTSYEYRYTFLSDNEGNDIYCFVNGVFKK